MTMTDPESSPVNTRPDYVYVASSWRCLMQPSVVRILKAAGIDHYDFRNPPNGTGFSWHEVMAGFDMDRQLADVQDYLAALEHPRSIEGFNADFEAMQRADTFVLVLPCGRSAHLELGWAVGQGKRTAILLDPATEKATPELMYRMADLVTHSMMDLLEFLGVED